MSKLPIHLSLNLGRLGGFRFPQEITQLIEKLSAVNSELWVLYEDTELTDDIALARISKQIERLQSQRISHIEAIDDAILQLLEVRDSATATPLHERSFYA